MKPATSEPSVGRRLLDQGWRQGAILSARGTSRGWTRCVAEEPGAGERWEWVTEPAPAEEWWVVASQDCDLAAPPEPRIELLRAFWTTDKGLLHMARLNSARRYLLMRRPRADGREEGLIVDATMHFHVEKASLAQRRPEEGFPALEQEARRRFGAWLARRYARPAIPDALVNAIQKPLVAGLRELRENDPVWQCLDTLEEIRFSSEGDGPPFCVSLLFLYRPGTQRDPLAEAELQGWCTDVLEQAREAFLHTAEFREPGSVSLADYLARQLLPLDEFSLGAD